MPIVVKIPGKVKSGGAKGHYCKQCFKVIRPDRIDSNESGKSRSRRTGRVVQKTTWPDTGCRKGVDITGETISESQTGARV